MSGVTLLVDTLLATRLGQRVAPVPLKAQAEIAGPGAVTNVEKADNDVRLPSREALQRQLGAALTARADLAAEFSPAKPVVSVSLSAAARAVNAVLNLPMGTTPAVRGRQPLQPDMRAPVVSVLTAVLARTVAESGLFYESHLQQYAAGLRTLGQLLQEPQAGVPLLVFPAAQAPVAEQGLSPAVALAALPGETDAALPPGMPTTDTPSLDAEVSGAAWKGSAEKAIARPEPVGLAATYSRTGLPKSMPQPVQEFSVQEDFGAQISEVSPSGPVHVGSPAAVIHPELTGLVRQQLEMLAVPVFRWSGEGWPGIPVSWEIRQEHGEQEAPERRAGSDDPEAALSTPAPWSTRLTLELPRLGAVDVRLGLAGAMLQLHMAASREGTAVVMARASAGLPRRFGAVGLELTDVQIAGRGAGATASRRNNDAGQSA